MYCNFNCTAASSRTTGPSREAPFLQKMPQLELLILQKKNSRYPINLYFCVPLFSLFRVSHLGRFFFKASKQGSQRSCLTPPMAELVILSIATVYHKNVQVKKKERERIILQHVEIWRMLCVLRFLCDRHVVLHCQLKNQAPHFLHGLLLHKKCHTETRNVTTM